MNKYEQFVETFETLLDGATMDAETAEVLEEIKAMGVAMNERPPLTEQGLAILESMQEGRAGDRVTASDIAANLGVSSRKVTGAIRKLTDDGFVGKENKNPVLYFLTEKGSMFDIDEYKETLNN